MKFFALIRRRPLVCLIASTAILCVLFVVRLLVAQHNVQQQFNSGRGLNQSAKTTPQKDESNNTISPRADLRTAEDLKTDYRIFFPEKAPLATIVQQLKTESDRGNILASCRLATELMRCDYLKQLPAAQERIRSRLVNAQKDADETARSTKALDRYSQMEKRDSAICNGFSNDQKLVSADYLFRAALAGHEPSMELYALTPPDIRNIITNPEALFTYRQYSNSMTFDLAARGNARAASALSRQYRGESFWNSLHLPSTLPIDYQEAAVWAYATSLSDHNLGNLELSLKEPRKHLNLEQLKQAEDRAKVIAVSFVSRSQKTPDEFRQEQLDRTENGIFAVCK